MTGFKKFQNVPLKIIPKEDRVKTGTLAICKGGCNRLSKISNTTYQLCPTCGPKWTYHGYSCDVPNCESEADGTIVFKKKENKMVCGNCYYSWQKMDFCSWEHLVESLQSHLLRPKTFVKALEDGIISPVEKENQVKYKEIAICQGGCNKLSQINNATYQLCSQCCSKWGYYGHSCDVPNCESEADGTIRFYSKENKMLCKGCYQFWKNMNYCIWERFVESRHSWLLRPKTYVKALKDGIISPVEKENRVKHKEVAECHHCHKEASIINLHYQLCATCARKIQFHGETCGVCEISDAISFVTTESIFVCGSCQQAKLNYKIASYQIYKTQIRTILSCQVCKVSISHDAENVKKRSANIDHDHDTGITRGVLCMACNQNEGHLKAWANNLNTDLLGVIELLKDYLENPPLGKSWVQET